MPHFAARSLVVLLPLATCLLGVGCNGGSSVDATVTPSTSSPTIDAYVAAVRDAQSEFNSRRAEIAVAPSANADLPLDEQIDRVRAYLSDLGPLALEFATRLEALAAPAGAAQTNHVLIIAAEDVRDRALVTLETVGGLETPQELDAQLAVFDDAVDTQLQSACLALQALADAGGVALDLACL